MSSTPPKSSKRFNPAQLLWNNLIGSEDRPCIPALRLPTNRVMQRYNTLKAGQAYMNELCVLAIRSDDVVWEAMRSTRLPT